MKKTVILLLFLGISTAFAARKPKGIVFFDLGDTLINKVNFNDPKSKSHYMPGAREHLQTLQKSGYLVGLITNIPDEWGATIELKIETMKKKVAERWEEKEPFDWEIFEGRVIVPPKDELRKPNPYMFVQAKSIAAKDKLKVLFEGEDSVEVAIAESQGFGAYQVFRKGFSNFPSTGAVRRTAK